MTYLQMALRRKVGSVGLSLRAAEKYSGVSFNTLARMRNGTYESRSVRSFLRACEWAGVDPGKALAPKNAPLSIGCGRFYGVRDDYRALLHCDAESLCPDCSAHHAHESGGE